jgi:hypothetical protein
MIVNNTPNVLIITKVGDKTIKSEKRFSDLMKDDIFVFCQDENVYQVSSIPEKYFNSDELFVIAKDISPNVIHNSDSD